MSRSFNVWKIIKHIYNGKSIHRPAMRAAQLFMDMENAVYGWEHSDLSSMFEGCADPRIKRAGALIKSGMGAFREAWTLLEAADRELSGKPLEVSKEAAA